MAACLQGDELPPAIQGPLMYMSPPFVAPGTGTIKIVLLPTNLTTMTQNGEPLLLKGATFHAIFTVQSPAMMPTPPGPQPDTMAVKPCTAKLITTNATIKAS